MRCPWGVPKVSLGRSSVARWLPVGRGWVASGSPMGIVSHGMPMGDINTV